MLTSKEIQRSWYNVINSLPAELGLKSDEFRAEFSMGILRSEFLRTVILGAIIFAITLYWL